MEKRVVIIGGVAGGASAAARLRRLDEFAEIVMLERGNYVSFANCGLPYYVGNVIKQKSSLELMTPELFLERFNIDVRVNNEAVTINREKKQIKVKDSAKNKEYLLDYDVLVLSPGAEAIKPPFKGMDEVPVFTLRTIPNSVEIEEFISKNKPESAVVVGGGFIGLEMAENLTERGVFVTIVELLDQVMMPLDKEMAQFVHQELYMNGVDLVLGDGVDSFKKDSDGKSVVITKSGREIKTDMVILGIGVKPESHLAKDSGLELGKKGHIIANERMQTSDPNIYAVGDAIEIQDFISGEPVAIPLAGPANKEGRIAADNIAGRDCKYDGVLGTSVVKVFDLAVSTVGWNEKKLKESDKKYEKIYVHPNNHAGYYPNSREITLKLLFETPNGKILGAQAVGGDGTDKRIDVISTVMFYNGTVYDLQRLELAYAPPFGSAKDPVNMAGYVASNVLKNDMKIWQWDQVEDVVKNKSQIVDVRTKEEYEVGHIKGAINISDEIIRENIDKLDKTKPIYLYCQVGFRGYLVYRNLIQRGFKDVRNLTGGYKLYEMANSSPGEMKKLYGDPKAIVQEMRKGRPADDITGLKEVVKVDACGLSCPGPLNALIKSVKESPGGSVIQVISSDPSFVSSAKAWTDLTDGVELLSLKKKDGNIVADVRKTKDNVNITVHEEPEEEPEESSEEKAKKETKKTHEEESEELRKIREAKKKSILERRKDSEVQAKPKKRGRVKPSGEPPFSTISAEELASRINNTDGPAVIIDVRPPREIRANGGVVPGAIVIPLGELMQSLDKIKQYKEDEVVTVCHSGSRSMMAAQLLARSGFKDVRSLMGGVLYWRRRGYKLAPPSA